jgi:hypothetical protein
MAFRTLARILLAALGVGALAAASQLGLAYGLGVVRLTRIFDVAGRDQWTAQLAWVAWFAMVAAVAGALGGGMLLHRRNHPAVRRVGGPAGEQGVLPSQGSAGPTAAGSGRAGAVATSGAVGGVWTRVALSLAAAIGAAVVMPLTMQPARTAQVAAVNAAVNPSLVIGLCAGLGAVIGIFAAYAALAHAVARWSLGTVIALVWVIAIVSVLPSLGPQDALPAVRLGVFDAGFLSPGITQRFALFTMPALALLSAAALGWAARRRGFAPLSIALAGLPGPALVTFSYLIAGPGEGGQRYQFIPYWAAMAAVATGITGATIAALIRRGDTDGPADDGSGAPGGLSTADAAAAGSPGAGPKPAGQPPLPRRVTGQPVPEQAGIPATAGPLGPRPSPAGGTGDTIAGGHRGGPTAVDPLTDRSRTGRSQHLDELPSTGTGPAAGGPPRPSGSARIPQQVGRPRNGPGVPTPRVAAPAVPVPYQVSAPLPNPMAVTPPITPPRPLDPHTDSGGGPSARPGAAAPVRKKDVDYVDWVTGLGGD